jgi:hypothetical protein
MDKNGVISYDEFARWFFTGMRAYNSQNRVIKVAYKRGTSLLEMLKKGSADAIASGSKIVKHRFSLSFNKPEQSGLKISAEVFPYGPTHVHLT